MLILVYVNVSIMLEATLFSLESSDLLTEELGCRSLGLCTQILFSSLDVRVFIIGAGVNMGPFTNNERRKEKDAFCKRIAY